MFRDLPVPGWVRREGKKGCKRLVSNLWPKPLEETDTLSFHHLSPSVFVLGNLTMPSPRRRLWAGSRDGSRISVQRKRWLQPAGTLTCQCCVYMFIWKCVPVYMCGYICVCTCKTSMRRVFLETRAFLQRSLLGEWKMTRERWASEFGLTQESPWRLLSQESNGLRQSHGWGASQAINSCHNLGELGSELGNNCSIVQGRDSESLSS